jgi:hypothetical protein
MDNSGQGFIVGYVVSRALHFSDRRCFPCVASGQKQISTGQSSRASFQRPNHRLSYQQSDLPRRSQNDLASVKCEISLRCVDIA